MTMQTFKKKLQNPFALIAQGFVVGSILFWATAPEASSAQVAAPATRSVANQG